MPNQKNLSDQMSYLAEQTGGGFMTLEQLLEIRGDNEPIAPVPPSFKGTSIQHMLLLRTCAPVSQEPEESRIKMREYALHCYLFRVLDLRLQEGFRLVSVVSTKQDDAQQCT